MGIPRKGRGQNLKFQWRGKGTIFGSNLVRGKILEEIMVFKDFLNPQDQQNGNKIFLINILVSQDLNSRIHFLIILETP